MGATAEAREVEKEAAFRELVERHSRMVFRVAFRITGNEQDAEDVVQEAFLKAYRNFESYDSRASFSTWIFRIASNCAIDVLRRRKRRPETPADDPDDAPSANPSPQASALSSEIARHLSRALEELTAQERTAFVLRHFEGQPIPEIARALGVRANAAKQTVFRAVRKLRLRLEPLREAAP